jgi:putative ABC transport system ATP-binding protein
MKISKGVSVMIQLKQVVKVYNPKKSNEFKALKGVSLRIEDGEMVAITGKSGAGKSTLLHIIACIDSYEDGEYYIDDMLVRDLSEKKLAAVRNRYIGIVMQDFALVEEFSALENVMLPLDFSKQKLTAKKDKAMEALKNAGISDLAKKKVNQLSGGQKQRVAIARAIVNEPQIIIADEPTGSLDSKTTEEIMSLFGELNRQGKTVVIVTHEESVAEMCQRRIVIQDGCILSHSETLGK